MYDYVGSQSDENFRCTSVLLDSSVWQNDFVTLELQAKGGMAIGAPTINMWCASWNKSYPTETITPSISGVGYMVKGYNNLTAATTLDITAYTGYKTDTPNIYFPTKNQTSEGVGSYKIASPSSGSYNDLIEIGYTGNVKGAIYLTTNANRPVVYLPPTVTLTPDATTENLWNINY